VGGGGGVGKQSCTFPRTAGPTGRPERPAKVERDGCSEAGEYRAGLMASSQEEARGDRQAFIRGKAR